MNCVNNPVLHETVRLLWLLHTRCAIGTPPTGEAPRLSLVAPRVQRGPLPGAAPAAAVRLIPTKPSRIYASRRMRLRVYGRRLRAYGLTGSAYGLTGRAYGLTGNAYGLTGSAYGL